jgi:hypothetical protein
MLLGFSGRYSAGNRGELAQIINVTEEKIPQIRADGLWSCRPPGRRKSAPSAMVLAGYAIVSDQHLA